MAAEEHRLPTMVAESVPLLSGQVATLRVVAPDTGLKILELVRDFVQQRDRERENAPKRSRHASTWMLECRDIILRRKNKDLSYMYIT